MMQSDHGDDRYRYPKVHFIADFSSNVPHISHNEGLWHYLTEHRELIHRYPEPRAYTLEKEIAATRGIESSEILVTSGATEAIYLISHLLQQSTSYIPQPTFSEYAKGAKAFGHKVVYLEIDSLIAGHQLTPIEGVVWLCNPNNPTGITYPHDWLTRLITSHPALTFVVDQSYASFTTLPLLTPEQIVSLPNCLVIHSLTKSYAIPGLRLGYVIANRDLIERLTQHKMPWSVNALALMAGQYLLRQPLPFKLGQLLAERSRWVEELKQLDVIKIYPTDTHYFCAELYRHLACEVKDWLAYHHNILIRDASTFPMLNDRFIRLATGTREQNNLLTEALSQLSLLSSL